MTFSFPTRVRSRSCPQRGSQNPTSPLGSFLDLPCQQGKKVTPKSSHPLFSLVSLMPCTESGKRAHTLQTFRNLQAYFLGERGDCPLPPRGGLETIPHVSGLSCKTLFSRTYQGVNPETSQNTRIENLGGFLYFIERMQKNPRFSSSVVPFAIADFATTYADALQYAGQTVLTFFLKGVLASLGKSDGRDDIGVLSALLAHTPTLALVQNGAGETPLELAFQTGKKDLILPILKTVFPREEGVAEVIFPPSSSPCVEKKYWIKIALLHREMLLNCFGGGFSVSLSRDRDLLSLVSDLLKEAPKGERVNLLQGLAGYVFAVKPPFVRYCQTDMEDPVQRCFQLLAHIQPLLAPKKRVHSYLSCEKDYRGPYDTGWRNSIDIAAHFEQLDDLSWRIKGLGEEMDVFFKGGEGDPEFLGEKMISLLKAIRTVDLRKGPSERTAGLAGRLLKNLPVFSHEHAQRGYAFFTALLTEMGKNHDCSLLFFPAYKGRVCDFQIYGHYLPGNVQEVHALITQKETVLSALKCFVEKSDGKDRDAHLLTLLRACEEVLSAVVSSKDWPLFEGLDPVFQTLQTGAYVFSKERIKTIVDHFWKKKRAWQGHQPWVYLSLIPFSSDYSQNLPTKNSGRYTFWGDGVEG